MPDNPAMLNDLPPTSLESGQGVVPAETSTPLAATDITGPDIVESQGVLFVDLDGTIIATDLLLEELIHLASRQSRLLGNIPAWVWSGRARFKRQLAQQAVPDVEFLPYRRDVLDFLTEQKRAGRMLVLATASDALWAHPIAAHLQLFDDVLASDGERNLKGRRKLEAIEEYCRDRQIAAFSYVGDARADLPIWDRAAEIYAVEPGPALRETLEQTGRLKRVFGQRGARWRAVVRALRPQQWVKNVLIFVPLVLAHQIANLPLLLAAALAFIAFSTCASAVYVLNDLLDVHADRKHPVKRMRPFAAGALPLSWGPALVGVPMLFGLLVAVLGLPLQFLAVLIVYLCVTTLYSFWLKKKVLVDVLTLAGLYTIRLFAGAVACGVILTEWLMAFSLFLFTSLAFVKRYAELTRLSSDGKSSPSRRGYRTSDLSLIESMGVTCGYLSVLVLALYIHHPEVTRLYSRPWALWLICPVMLYWISRIWIQAKRQNLSEDPIVFAIKDRISLLAGAACVVLLAIAAGV